MSSCKLFTLSINNYEVKLILVSMKNYSILRAPARDGHSEKKLKSAKESFLLSLTRFVLLFGRQFHHPVPQNALVGCGRGSRDSKRKESLSVKRSWEGVEST